MKNISFDNPYLLLLIIPLLICIIVPVVLAIRKENKSRAVFLSMGIHILIALLITLALGGMVYTTVMTETQVVVVADVSYSSNRNLGLMDEYVEELYGKLPGNSTLAVVTFGKDCELHTEFGAPLTSVSENGVDDSATDISSALNYAVTLFSEDVIRRVVLITDGKETHADAAGKLVSAVENLYANDVYLDAVYLDNNLPEDAREVQISDVSFAASTYLHHETTAEALVQSSYDTTAIAVLYVEGERVENRAVTLTRGYNLVSFDLPTGSTGRYEYRIAITTEKGDGTTANNTYDFTQTVVGRQKVLLISWDEADLARAEELYGDDALITAYIKDPDVPCTVEDLCEYDEILLSNFDIRDLNNVTSFVDSVDKVVSMFGKSLVTMGDLRIQNKSDGDLRDLEDMLPVKFGNSDQDPRLYAIVIDSSRSMQLASRLIIAKQAAIQLINMMDADDYVMIVNFWGEINVLQAPTRAANREELAALVNSIQPYQGTVIGTALDKAGELMVDMAFDEKQIMLISDGMSYALESDIPSEVAAELLTHGITTSVIHGPAREEGKDTLVGIAEAGGGEYYPVNDADALLDVMFNEIADDLTESVIEDRTPVNLARPSDGTLRGIVALPDVGGYVYAKAKATATTVLTVTYETSGGRTVDVPLYAYWSYGNGRVASYTSTLAGEWTADWREESGDRFFENLLVENTPEERLDDPYTLNVDYDGSYSTVEIIPVILKPEATVDAVITLPDDTQLSRQLTFDSTRYFYRFETPLRGRYIITVTYTVDGREYVSESVFNIPYSPEYNSFEIFDPAALHAAVRNRGTVYEGTLPSLVNDDKEVATYVVYFTVPLMIAAIALYVIDIIIRKLKWADVKSFFGIGSRKGGKR